MQVAARGLERRLSPGLFAVFTAASIGGPLALGALYLPGTADEVLSSAGFTTLAAIVVFAAPLAIWAAYSRRIASPAGLTGFVEAAAGRRLARVQAAIWAVAYALYLPYTVTFVVYDLLPVVVPGIKPYRAALELVLPVLLAVLVLAPLVWVVGLRGVVRVGLLGLRLTLGALTLANAGSASGSFVPHAAAGTTAKAIGGVGTLFVCASLPLFAGAEVRGGTRAIRRGLVGGFALVAAYLLFQAFPLAGVPDSLIHSEIPGMAIAQAYSGHALAVAVGLGVAASVTGLIVAEYLALGRLAHAMLGVPVRRALAAIAVPFVLLDALSLTDPNGSYDTMLKPSLIALFVAQLVVFAVYPLYRRSIDRLRMSHVALAAVAMVLLGYGLYTAVANPAT